MRHSSLAVAVVFAAFSVVIASACAGSGDQGEPNGGGAVRFQIFKGGANVDCRTISEIERVEVTVFATDGLSVRPGYPRPVDCQSGQVDLTALQAGDHIVEVVAYGKILGADDAVLFKARSPITAPSGQIDLSLKPEVSFLSIDWTFEERGLTPCAEEVGEIQVLLAASSGPRLTYDQKFSCMGTPVEIAMPLPVLNYTIRIDAYSPEEYPVYTLTSQRVLERGDNRLSAILRPQGSILYFDWEFEVGRISIRDCADARVNAAEVKVSVVDVNAAGSGPTEQVDCSADRPYAFLADRFQAGRTLDIEITSTGTENFRGTRRVQTKGDDLYVPTIVLEAVGTATAAITVATATCASAQYDGFTLFAVDNQEAAHSFMVPLEMNETTKRLENLPYASYDLFVLQRNGDTPVCTARGQRVIDGPENDWAPFTL